MRYQCLWNPVLLPLCLVALVLVGACATSTSRKVEEDSYATSFSLHGDRHDADLTQGRELKIDGQYEQAAALYTRVYRSPSASDEQREEALYERGIVLSHLLNPAKDLDGALDCFRKLIAEFPDSDRIDDARERIAAIEKRQAEQAGP